MTERSLFAERFISGGIVPVVVDGEDQVVTDEGLGVQIRHPIREDRVIFSRTGPSGHALRVKCTDTVMGKRLVSNVKLGPTDVGPIIYNCGRDWVLVVKREDTGDFISVSLVSNT